MMKHYVRLACFVGGALFGSAGVKLLTSKDAKKAYTHITAAGLRMKDSVMETVTSVQENAADILAAAKDINEARDVKEAEALMEELRTISQMALDRCSVENLRDWNSLKSAIKGDVSDYLFKKTKRSPMVLPIIMEI